ncbi:MAG TPA: porin family protein [Flavipsychrobacter sp.]
MAEHDDKAYYFGITFGLNYSSYRLRYTESFTEQDTFKIIESRFGPGFNLGLMGNLRLSKFIDLRFVPSLAFAEKRLKVNTRSAVGTDSIYNRSIESIYMHMPLQLKFKSDRIGNFRFYGLAGGKFDIDLAANARSRRRDEFLKVRPFDAGYEIGVGFEFYYPNFIFSPEIKLSQGLMNQQYKDSRIPLSNAIEQINTRMIVISIHLEG